MRGEGEGGGEGEVGGESEVRVRVTWKGEDLRGVDAIGAVGEPQQGGEREEVREGEVARGGLSKG